MSVNASTPFLGGNPYQFTSGFIGGNVPTAAKLVGKHKIQRLYWEQPDLSSTSSLLITKKTATGMIYAELKCEVSGQSQQLNLGDQWWSDPYVNCVPSGTFWIYLDN
jgi:hypothetical protein